MLTMISQTRIQYLQVYRDEETVRASEAAARFALLTERDEQILHRSRKFDSQ